MFVSLGGRTAPYSSVAIPFPSECARHTSGPSRVVAEGLREGVSKPPPYPQLKVIKVMHSRGQGLADHAFAGTGPASREAGCKAGAVIYGSPGQGTHGRLHPSEEVIRVLPGGSRERGYGPGPFQSYK